jgi:hypothetical protein
LHGDLPANEKVLAGIHELLITGVTSALEPQIPVERAIPVTGPWRKASDIAPIPPEVNALIGTRGGARRIKTLDATLQRLVESEMLQPFIGARRAKVLLPASPPAKAVGKRPRGRASPPVRLEVMWGDICRANGEIYAAGHYQGVLPQAGERALDEVVSGVIRGQSDDARELVITSHTRRGIIRGAVGDVNFFPWANARKTVAVAGMGYPGTFGRSELQRLARSLAESVSAIPGARTFNLLLIGSGNGNLPWRGCSTDLSRRWAKVRGARPSARSVSSNATGRRRA